MTEVHGFSLAHLMYLLGVLAIILTMVLRANVVVPALVASFLVGLAYSGSLIQALETVFNASLVAARELFNIFLVIALMTALLNALRVLRSDVRMVEPFRRIMANGHIAYVVLAAMTYVLSLFFWPTPAVPLVGAILLPAAISAGLPPMGCALAIAIAGQGMALASDYVIRVGPGISAKAAGVDMNLVADRCLLLSWIVGGIALVLCYLNIRRHIVPASDALLERWQQGAGLADQHAAVQAQIGSFDKARLVEAIPQQPMVSERDIGSVLAALPSPVARWSGVFAVLAPLAFLAVVLAMLLPKFVPGMAPVRGGEAAALVGGTAALLLVLASLAGARRRFLDATADHVIDGFVFAFKAMGAVLPIAGFFFIGAADTSGAILGTAPGSAGPDFLFEMLKAAQGWVPSNHYLVAFSVLVVGMITGIDGSGYAGLPLTGSLSGALGQTVGMDPVTLAAVGQMGAVWTGGGTLIAWSSLLAVTGFARVPVLEAVRQMFVPVVAGLVAATVIAVLIG